jgi:hypothetical protein
MISRRWGGLGAIVSGLLVAACGSSSSNGPGNQPGGAGAAGMGNGIDPGNVGAGNGSGTSGTSGQTGPGGDPTTAGIQMRIAAPVAPTAQGNHLLAFTGGGAVRPGLVNLEYYIYAVSICESLEPSGSGFSNPSGCLQLYSGDQSRFSYDINGDWTHLADEARATDDGFVDLLDPSSRAALGNTTALGSSEVRSYHYGIITWSLPIKVKATIPLGDGSFLYTHDGTTTYQIIGADHYKDYYTSPAIPLDVGPAEKAVVILGNGGNWFQFQNPLTITQEDLDQKRQWVLDLVFNPEGIVKGFSGEGSSRGNLREQSEAGAQLRGITVPMLDLAPVPHRADQEVERESYIANVQAGSQNVDTRIELYSVAGDPSATVYGVDVKTLVRPEGHSVPPEISKISSLATESDGSLSFKSFSGTSVISGFHRVAEEHGTTHATLVCAGYGNSAAANGGAAIIMDGCPSANLDVTFTLVGRRTLDGSIPIRIEGDAGPDAAPPGADAGEPGDAGAPDSGADVDSGL